MPVYPMDGDGYSTEESLPDELNLEDELQPHRTSQLDEHGRAVMIALTELVRHIESTGADDELDLLTRMCKPPAPATRMCKPRWEVPIGAPCSTLSWRVGRLVRRCARSC